MKAKRNFKNLAFFLLGGLLLFSCAKMDNPLPRNKNREMTGSPMAINAAADLVTTDWKGVVWDAYNKDWNHVATVDDGREIAAGGIKWARIWVSAGTSDAVNDSMVSRCAANNIKIVACYNKTNPSNDLGDATQQAQQVTALKAFVNRYKTNIKYYEIGNEPNLLSYWNIAPGAWNGSANPQEVGRGSTDSNSIYNAGVKRYVQWLHLAYDAIKLTDSTATVMNGGLSSYIMSDFMNRFTIEKGYLYCDEAAFHPYDSNGPDGVINQLNAFKAKQGAWPSPKNTAPIWITEIGFQDADENLKAANLTGTMVKLIQNLAYSRPIFWYILHDNNFALIQQSVSGSTVTTTYFPAYYANRDLNQSWSFYKNGGGANLITNSTFEANGASQTPIGWSEANDVAASYTDGNSPHSGTYKLSHWSAVAYQTYTYQNKTGLVNGLYTLRAWVKRAGTQTPCQMEAKNFGGTQINLSIPVSGNWTQITIPNINVTNTTCTIGFYSYASAGDWCQVDDVEFYKQ